MATKLPKEEIQERFKRLPEDLREAIFSSEVAELLLSIGKKYGIHIDKLGELSAETMFVMLGVTHPRDFIPTLEKTLGVSKDAARNIAQDVNMLVFSRIRESLKKIHNIPDENTVKEPISGAPAFTQKPFLPATTPSPQISAEPRVTPRTDTFSPGPATKKEFVGPTTPVWRDIQSAKTGLEPALPPRAPGAGGISSEVKKEAPVPPPSPQKPAWQDIKKEMEKQKAPHEKIISKESAVDAPGQKKNLEEELAPLLNTFPSVPPPVPAPEKKEIPLPPKAEVPPLIPAPPPSPISAAQRPSSPFEEKVKDGIFRAQPIESTKDAAPQTTPPQSFTQAIQTTKDAQQEKRYPTLDPYREPVDPKDLSPKKPNA